ncbi:MAG: GYD domain-containing protein [Desulfobaccales bacterium]
MPEPPPPLDRHLAFWHNGATSPGAEGPKGREVMALFLMFGKYSAEGIKGISAQRTQQAEETIRKFGGSVSAMYALLGDKDLLLVTEFPDIGAALKASVALSKLTGIAFSTAPAVTVAEFDRLMAGL